MTVCSRGYIASAGTCNKRYSRLWETVHGPRGMGV